jgi:hypothetical protein
MCGVPIINKGFDDNDYELWDRFGRLVNSKGAD